MLQRYNNLFFFPLFSVYWKTIRNMMFIQYLINDIFWRYKSLNKHFHMGACPWI